MTLRMTDRECPTWEHERDHIAEACVLGSAIVTLPRRKRAATRALPIMRLNDGEQSTWRVPRPSR
jgi:hypothetical protein